MRKKEERFVVTFSTTTGAMSMERACRTAGLPGRLIPVPRSITAGCGMCWSAPPSARADLEALVIRERLDVDGLFAVLRGGGESMSANCVECVYYDYDEELAAYVCEADLDEDEMERFLRGGTRDCPFYRPGDDYRTARRQ